MTIVNLLSAVNSLSLHTEFPLKGKFIIKKLKSSILCAFSKIMMIVHFVVYQSLTGVEVKVKLRKNNEEQERCE